MQTGEFNLATTVKKTLGISGHPTVGSVDPTSTTYVHYIPKNASSFLQELLAQNQWNDVVSANKLLCAKYPIQHQLAVIRDPVCRWTSGISEFLSTVFDDFSLLQEQWYSIQKIIFWQPYQDTHTAPQLEFFHDLVLDNFEFVLLDNNRNIKPQIKRWFELKEIPLIGIDHIVPINITTTFDQKQKIYNLVKQTIDQNLDLKNGIEQYYQGDYKLINWITENQKWIQ